VAYEFKLPDLGEGLTEGEVARWFVAEGDSIAEDEPLVEIQTDKTTVEILSPAAGTVLRILVAEGQVAPVGAVLVVIGDEGEQLLRPVDDEPAVQPVPEPVVAAVPPEPLAAVRATPLVRRLAQELGVELATVEGSGPGGRVTEEDVRTAGAFAAMVSEIAAPAFASEGRRAPVRGIRRLIVEQVSASHREIPAVTYLEECDFTDVDRSLLVPLVLQATALALREFPELNARLEEDEIVYLDRYDVGLAVQTDQGLVVPVVRGCDELTIQELAAETGRLAEAARTGSLLSEELRGSTFTVTSAGKLGGLVVTPLINHPEVGILGIHRIAPRPVVRDGEIVARDIGNVSVTFDHRVVDGARAASFCLDIIDRLQRGAA
jgi:pyruvate/2-oxoglutarate dehydrogenase complex dihydrolipoamide acyltransferase (E2) component